MTPVTTHPTESLADAMRARTTTLHRRAERTGFISRLLRGEINASEYAQFLSSLLRIYRTLEDGLELHKRSPAVRRIAWPTIYRTNAIRDDLAAISETVNIDSDASPRACSAYVRRIEHVIQHAPERLVAHAYVRYLGDLNGGQLLKSRVRNTLQLDDAALSFYDFPDVQHLRSAYRAAIEAAGNEVRDWDPVVGEAAVAFRLNIGLSAALIRSVPANASSGLPSQRDH